MKFVRRDLGETAEVNSGGGVRGTLAEATKLTILAIVLFAGIYFAVGLVTELVVSSLSVERERNLFAEFTYGTYATEPPAEFAETWSRALTTLDALRAGHGVPNLEYKLVYDSSVIPNAMALPGGTVVLTKGLLDAVGGEDIALAFVLGHELGHFANRDHLRGIGRRAAFRLCLIILFGWDVDSWANNAAELLLLHYSRQQETAADAFAIQCLWSTYDDLDGAERFFEALLAEQALPEWAYMFSTHPELRERIETIRAAK